MVLATLFLTVVFIPQMIIAQPYYLQTVQQGFDMKIWLADDGEMGLWPGWEAGGPYEVGLQYPPETPIEHLYDAGLWIGAVEDVSPDGTGKYVKLVTTCDESDSLGSVGSSTGNFTTPAEMLAVDSGNSWRRSSINEHDSGAVSENVWVCTYTDTGTHRFWHTHTPLGVKVIERSMAWVSAVRKPILPVDYEVINLGTRRIKDIYIGIHFSPWVGPTSGSPYVNGNDTTAFRGDVLGHWPELLTTYVQNAIHSPSTPLGITLLSKPVSSVPVGYSYRWLSSSDWAYLYKGWRNDSNRYNYMSGVYPPGMPLIRPNPSTEPSHWGYDVLLSFGPFPTWSSSETLKCSFAFVGGQTIRGQPDNIYDNATFAQTLAARNFVPPVILPSPKLRTQSGPHRITLHWGYNGTGPNPQAYWDDYNKLVELYPPDHWRRINPPAGHTTGGRVFMGYRLYRSEDPSGIPSSFTLLRQWDVKDSLFPQLGYGTGIDTMFVDSSLTIDKVYWYAVTAYGIPDAHILDYMDFDGTMKVDTLYSPSTESSLTASRIRVKIPFAPSSNLNKVLVVPNPYRTDQNYTFENGGWEGRQQSWTENNRLLKFINLPQRCRIRIFSLVGDIVKTIEHDDPVKGEENWDLLTESGRTVASGVFIFTVESELGTQTGKFAIIR
ncbi:MAG TPA: hypothetical protein VLY03_08105 [Bacteroidota bacterium]|nr:hypothetical protein [Bacteroidota bacterium]